MLRTKLVLACSFAAVAACSHSNGNGGGDGGGGGGDGGSGSGAVDANVADAAGPACDYTEMSDATNGSAAEATGLTIGTTTRNLCGQVDPGHYDATSQIADVDMYTVSVSGGTAELILEFENQQPAGLTDFLVEIFDTNTPATLLYAGDYTGALADHGAYIAELPTGSFNVVVTATASAAVATAIPYKVRIVDDKPTTRCPDMTGMTADYTEANDGAANNGNDVVLIDFAKSPSFTLTPSTTDMPEPSGLTIDPAKNSHVVGSSALVAAGTDTYLDRDTYAFATGANMNELTVRLNWPGSTADLDYVVFPAGVITAANEAATLTSTSEDEFATFAVQPNAMYWLWIGAYDGSTGLPIQYSATVCGGQFAP